MTATSKDTVADANKDVMTDLSVDDDQIITPWRAENKSGKFNYKRLVEQFGVEEITDELLDRFKKVTGHEPHPWMRRKLFFAHRHLNDLLDSYEKGEHVFLYTGRGPTTSSMHIGHGISFILTQWLQNVFNAIVIIQIADDEKVWFKNMNFDEVYKLGFENSKDIISFGFNPEKTFIFSNRDYSLTPCYHKVVCSLLSTIKINEIQDAFGLDPSGCAGTLLWPIYQMSAAISKSFESILKGNEKCLVVYGCDQDLYFRIIRNVAPKLGYDKPCSIMGQFLPALTGNSKMSSTGENGQVTTIFMTDTKKEIETKIKKYAFSGGGESVEEHRKKGADLSVDIPYQWLMYFCDNDEDLAKIAEEYGSGKMLTGEIKKILIDKVWEFVKNHQEKRAKVTDDLLKYFYDINKFKK